VDGWGAIDYIYCIKRKMCNEYSDESLRVPYDIIERSIQGIKSYWLSGISVTYINFVWLTIKNDRGTSSVCSLDLVGAYQESHR
jgi:hypothetical protein